MDRSYVYNSLKQQIFQDFSFVVTLSFSQKVQLKTIKLKQSDEIQFLVSQNGSQHYFFYVPTGTKLQEYKQLNLKSHTYQQIFQGFYIVLQGYLFGQIQYKLQCNQYQYYNNIIVNQSNFQDVKIQEGFNEINDQIFIVNPHNKNYTVFLIVCHSDVTNKTVQLYYNVKALPCQLGEYLFQNECLDCNLNQSQYSVTHNSTKCNYIDYTQIKSFKKGLLQLHLKYWRHNYYSSIIEYCNSNDCNGGWIPGDNSCIKSRLGALCKECDLYNTKGDGYFTKNNEQCQLCQDFNLKFILQLSFTILWQLLVIFNGYYSNYKLSQQYLMYRVGFREYYQILYRQSIDQTNIFIKIFINYIFLLYIIRSNLDTIGQTFVVNINIINNPGLILKAQLDCLLSRGFNIEIIYSQYIFQILLVFFILSLSYTIFFIIIDIKKLKFHIGVVLYLTEAILIYNLNIIIDISFNLLSYRLASGQKWIQQNMQYLFYTDQHMQMLKLIIPVTSILFISPIIFPYAMKKISVFNRLAKRIYAVYHQEYKPQLIFWEYLIIYTKYAQMIFQIMDDKLNQEGIILILFLTLLGFNQKPYYLQNFNSFELNLFTLYAIQLLLMMYLYKDMLIIFVNFCVFIYFVQKIYISFYVLNLKRAITWKQSIIEKLPKFRSISGIEKNQTLQNNKILLIKLIRTKILKKTQIQFVGQKLLTETEIEMSIMLKNGEQKNYPSRFEPNN